MVIENKNTYKTRKRKMKNGGRIQKTKNKAKQMESKISKCTFLSGCQAAADGR